MIYNDFKRVNDIDDQIMALHRQMLSLYDEKSMLLGANVPTPRTAKAAKMPKPVANQTTKQLYETLKQEWERFDVHIPAYVSLKSKLAKMQAILELVAQEDPQSGAHGILVPPTSSLMKALSHKEAPSVDVESFNALNLTANKTWQCAIMFERPSRQIVNDVRNFVPMILPSEHESTTYYTGVRTLMAAYLQGLEVADDTTWTMPLGDMDSSYQTPCARIVNDSLQFTVDDSAGLLGSNYYYPSITVKA